MDARRTLLLAVHPRRIRAVERAPALAGRSVRRHSHTVYFDTPRLRFLKHGIILALKRSGMRWEQSISRLDVANGAVHRFVDRDTPQLTMLDVPVLGAALDREPEALTVKPVFEADLIEVSRRIAVGPETRIAVSIDHGWLRNGKESQRVSEVKLELLAGESAALMEFAERLRASVPFILQSHTKIERGYALHRRAGIAPMKAQHVVLVPDMSVTSACSAVTLACLKQFEANQIGMLESDDIEFLHQMRVALRRLRSAVRVFRAALPEQVWSAPLVDMRWLARVLGPARDWDVFTFERLRPVRAHFKHEPGMAQVVERCDEARLAALRRARRAVRSARCQCFLLKLRASMEARTWLATLNPIEQQTAQQNVVPYAASILEQRYALVRRRGRNIGRLPEIELHRLRIAVKKLRYAAEFFGALFDQAKFDRFRAVATELQDVLGNINDAATADTMLARLNEPRDPEVMMASALLAGWNRHEVHRRKDELSGLWEAFRGAPPFWR